MFIAFECFAQRVVIIGDKNYPKAYFRGVFSGNLHKKRKFQNTQKGLFGFIFLKILSTKTLTFCLLKTIKNRHFA